MTNYTHLNDMHTVDLMDSKVLLCTIFPAVTGQYKYVLYIIGFYVKLFSTGLQLLTSTQCTSHGYKDIGFLSDSGTNSCRSYKLHSDVCYKGSSNAWVLILTTQTMQEGPPQPKLQENPTFLESH